MLSESLTFDSKVDSLRHAVHQKLGWTYRASSFAPPSFLPMNAFGMVTTRGKGFDFRGAVDGIAFGAQRFSLADVTARKLEPGKHDDGPQRAGFEGVIISLNHERSFAGRTIIRRDKGRLNWAKIDTMKRVGLVDPTFERVFEVYSDDQVEARALISPDFKERLLAFNDDFLGRGVQLAFLAGQVHIALDIDERFSFNRGNSAYDFEQARGTILHEIGSIFTLLEAVQTLQARVGRKGAAAADAARLDYYRELMELLMKEIDEMKSSFETPSRIREDLRYTHYLFCDGIKGLLSPRF